MKLLKLLILFILFLFPFGELLRFDVGNNIVLKPLDVVVGLTVVWWIVLQVQNLKFKIQSLKKNYFLLPLLSFSSIGFVALLINLTWLAPNNFLASLLYLVRFVSYALLFPLVLQFDQKFKKKIKLFLLIDGLVIVIFGFLQYFFYNGLGNLFYLGWDEHKHRIFSIFFDPNFAGAFFVLYLLFVGGFLFNAVKKKKQKEQIIFSSIMLLTLLAVFLTFSRSALLTLIVGASTLLFLINKKKLLLWVFGAIILFGIIASPKFDDENMNLFRGASSSARLGNYAVAIKVFQNHPVVGVGFNSYRYTKELYGFDHEWIKAPSHADAGVDNSFLFVLATTGIIGFVVYAWLWVNILKRAFAAHRKKFQIGAVIVIASSFALFTNALFINSLFFAPLMLWVWMIFGLSEDLG
jgi:O-antigen ligase